MISADDLRAGMEFLSATPDCCNTHRMKALNIDVAAAVKVAEMLEEEIASRAISVMTGGGEPDAMPTPGATFLNGLVLGICVGRREVAEGLGQ